jgi:hypothetical protein
MRLPDSPGAAGTPARRKLPLWAIALLSVAGLCALGCVLLFAGVTYFGAQAGPEVDSVLTTMEAELSTIEAATPEGGGLVIPTLERLPTVAPAGSAEAAPTTGGVGGIAGGAAGTGASGAALVQTAQAATAEARATETAAVEATAETEQLFGGAVEVFSDEFVDNRNAWFVGVFQEIETDVIEDGVFKVIWADNGSSYELYEVSELANFIAEVDCRVAMGGADGSCGLVFGQQADAGFYKFELFEDYYRLFIVQPEGEPPILAEGNPAEIMRPGDWNRVRVVRQGDRIRVAVNGFPVADVDDLTFPIGKVGVSTNSYKDGPGVEVQFDNITIWELPS